MSEFANDVNTRGDSQIENKDKVVGELESVA